MISKQANQPKHSNKSGRQNFNLLLLLAGRTVQYHTWDGSDTEVTRSNLKKGTFGWEDGTWEVLRIFF